jgi:hypothetical protein
LELFTEVGKELIRQKKYPIKVNIAAGESLVFYAAPAAYGAEMQGNKDACFMFKHELAVYTPSFRKNLTCPDKVVHSSLRDNSRTPHDWSMGDQSFSMNKHSDADTVIVPTPREPGKGVYILPMTPLDPQHPKYVQPSTEPQHQCLVTAFEQGESQATPDWFEAECGNPVDAKTTVVTPERRSVKRTRGCSLRTRRAVVRVGHMASVTLHWRLCQPLWC